jgi:hypothetical protein
VRGSPRVATAAHEAAFVKALQKIYCCIFVFFAVALFIAISMDMVLPFALLLHVELHLPSHADAPASERPSLFPPPPPPPPHAAATATATAIKFRSAVGSAPASEYQCAHMQPRRLHSPDCSSRARCIQAQATARTPLRALAVRAAFAHCLFVTLWQVPHTAASACCARGLFTKRTGQLHRRRRRIILSRLFHP